MLSLALLILLPDSIPALWIGTIGFGFSIASMIASSFNLAERRMPITSQVSSTFLVGGSLGSMTLPWLVGQLFVPYGRLSVMYVTAAAMLGAWFVFALIVRQKPRPGEDRAVAAAVSGPARQRSGGPAGPARGGSVAKVRPETPVDAIQRPVINQAEADEGGRQEGGDRDELDHDAARVPPNGYRRMRAGSLGL